MSTRIVPISQQGMPMRKTSVEEIGDKIVGMVDEIEKRVETLRETAAALESEKESLMEMISTVQLNKEMLRLGPGTREDMEATTNRLLNRCRTVTVAVSTPRNDDQARALHIVNDEIEALLERMKDDLGISKQKCQGFLNACMSEQPQGPIDQKFQSVLIECTADDQKKVRKRLANLFQIIMRAEKTIDMATGNF